MAMTRRIIELKREECEIYSYSPSRRFIVVRRCPPKPELLQSEEGSGVFTSILYIIQIEGMKKDEICGMIKGSLLYPKHMCITDVVWSKNEEDVVIEAFSSDTMMAYSKCIALK